MTEERSHDVPVAAVGARRDADGARTIDSGDLPDGSPARIIMHMARRLQRASEALAALQLSNDAGSVARQALQRGMQDRDAEVFRLKDRLRLSGLDAEEAHARVLDLEAEVRREQSRFMELQARTHEVGELLHKALDAHAQANSIWEAELARMGESSAREISGLLAARDREMTQLQQSHERHVAALNVAHQSELAQVREALGAEREQLRTLHCDGRVPLKQRLEAAEARLHAQSGLRGASAALWRAILRRLSNATGAQSRAPMAAPDSGSDPASDSDEQ